MKLVQNLSLFNTLHVSLSIKREPKMHYKQGKIQYQFHEASRYSYSILTFKTVLRCRKSIRSDYISILIHYLRWFWNKNELWILPHVLRFTVGKRYPCSLLMIRNKSSDLVELHTLCNPSIIGSSHLPPYLRAIDFPSEVISIPPPTLPRGI